MSDTQVKASANLGDQRGVWHGKGELSATAG